MDKYVFFWKTMELCDWDKAGDDMMVLEPVIDYLSRQSDRKIHMFHNQMNELLHALDTRALAEQCNRTYEKANDDTFLYSSLVSGVVIKASCNSTIFVSTRESLVYTSNWSDRF